MRNATIVNYFFGLLLITAIAGAGSWWLYAEATGSKEAPSAAVSNAEFEEHIAELTSRVDILEARHNLETSHIDTLINEVTALRIKAETPEPGPGRRGFEVSEDRAQELVPGVKLTISHTDVEHQQVSGWLYLQDEHRVLWLKNHGLLRPITFYGADDHRQRDIVITRVHDNDAVGYVLTAAK